MTAREVLTEIPPRCRNPKCRAVRQPRRHTGGYDGAAGYCRPCWDRWHAHGTPADGPPDPMSHAERAAITNAERSRAAEERLQKFARIRRRGYSIAIAARCVGVAEDTGRRYAAELRRRQQREEDSYAA